MSVIACNTNKIRQRLIYKFSNRSSKKFGNFQPRLQNFFEFSSFYYFSFAITNSQVLETVPKRYYDVPTDQPVYGTASTHKFRIKESRTEIFLVGFRFFFLILMQQTFIFLLLFFLTFLRFIKKGPNEIFTYFFSIEISCNFEKIIKFVGFTCHIVRSSNFKPHVHIDVEFAVRAPLGATCTSRRLHGRLVLVL